MVGKQDNYTEQVCQEIVSLIADDYLDKGEMPTERWMSKTYSAEMVANIRGYKGGFAKLKSDVESEVARRIEGGEATEKQIRRLDAKRNKRDKRKERKSKDAPINWHQPETEQPAAPQEEPATSTDVSAVAAELVSMVTTTDISDEPADIASTTEVRPEVEPAPKEESKVEPIPEEEPKTEAAPEEQPKAKKEEKRMAKTWTDEEVMQTFWEQSQKLGRWLVVEDVKRLNHEGALLSYPQLAKKFGGLVSIISALRKTYGIPEWEEAEEKLMQTEIELSELVSVKPEPVAEELEPEVAAEPEPEPEPEAQAPTEPIFKNHTGIDILLLTEDEDGQISSLVIPSAGKPLAIYHPDKTYLPLDAELAKKAPILANTLDLVCGEIPARIDGIDTNFPAPEENVYWIIPTDQFMRLWSERAMRKDILTVNANTTEIRIGGRDVLVASGFIRL